MPAEFEACRKTGGRIRTVSGPSEEHGLEKGEYVRYCIKGGKSCRGHVKQAKKGTESAERAYKRTRTRIRKAKGMSNASN